MHTPSTSKLLSKRSFATLAALALGSTLVVGCASEDEGVFPSRPGEGQEDPGGTGPGGTDPGPVGPGGECKPGRTYDGFGGDVLGGSRVEAGAGTDRQRIKPLSALRTEYTRVLGAVPGTLQANAASIGQPQARFFAEAESNAVALYSTYAVSFDGCQAMMTGAPYTTAPTAESAKTVCADLGRKFWSRTLTTAEIDSCATLATTGLPKATEPRRTWAHVCASLLTSAGFLTY